MKSFTDTSSTAPLVHWAGVASGVLALGTDALYLYVIWRQESTLVGRTAFVATMLAALGITALVGASRSLPTMLVAAAGGLMVFGFLGIFSIGALLLAAAGLALWAALATRRIPSILGTLLSFWLGSSALEP